MRLLSVLLLLFNPCHGTLCPDNIVLVGRDVLCPNEVGLYHCQVIGGTHVNLNVAGENFGFDGDQLIGSLNPGTNGVLVLLRRDTEGIEGNRTVLFEFTPGPSVRGLTPITCSVGLDECVINVMVVDTENFSSPMDFNDNRMNEESQTIFHSWSHKNMELVDRFHIILDTVYMPRQVIQINTTNITISRIPGLSYSGNLSAVSICGRESEPLRFNVNIPRLSIPATSMPTSKATSLAPVSSTCGSNSLHLEVSKTLMLLLLLLGASVNSPYN